MFPRNPFLIRLTSICVISIIIIHFFSQDIVVRVAVEPIYQPIKIVSGDHIQFKINQEQCSDDVYLAIYVHSKPENVERRRVIRYSWGALNVMNQLKARLVFITGVPDNQQAMKILGEESWMYGDIIQSDFQDTYRNLTYKAISGLKWVTKMCPSSKFVLKSDDDMVIDIYKLVDVMKTRFTNSWGLRNILACHTWDKMDVIRNKSSKWYTSEQEYPDEFFQRYCSGSAFFMTSDVSQNLYTISKRTPFFWIDDYYVTGMLAKALGLTAINYNNKYIVQDSVDIKEALAKDRNTREIMFVHSPNTVMSVYVWKTFLTRRKLLRHIES